MKPVPKRFFRRDPREVAPDLLGKVLRHRMNGRWLEARIIETEAYLLEERGSHASLGWSPSREALFMEPGTIYMYYARGGDSFNLSCFGEGNAVLFKSGIPHPPEAPDLEMLEAMQRNNPVNGRKRPPLRLCSGQTLLCRFLGLKVPEWNRQLFRKGVLELGDPQDPPEEIIQTTRLGIPKGRDGHLLLRYLDVRHAASSTKNPLSMRKPQSMKRFCK